MIIKLVIFVIVCFVEARTDTAKGERFVMVNSTHQKALLKRSQGKSEDNHRLPSLPVAGSR